MKKTKTPDTAKASQQSDIPTKISKQISDYFAEYFYKNINQCISKSIFPSDLKLADVTKVYKKKSKNYKNNGFIKAVILNNIFKTQIQQMRTRIQRMRRTWRTQRIRQTLRIWRIQWIQRIPRIRRIQRIRRIPYAIFKRFFSFIYPATKCFMSSSKLSSELYLDEAWTTNKY